MVDIWTLVSVRREPTVSVRCYDSQPFPEGDTGRSPSFKNGLPAIPGDMFCVGIICNNRGDVRIRQENVVYFVLVLYRPRVIVESHHQEGAFGLFDRHRQS